MKPRATPWRGPGGTAASDSGAPPRELSNLWRYAPAIREDRTAVERPLVRGADGTWTCTRDLLAR